MSEGIKESKEALTGAMELSIFIYSRVKDGVDVDDAIALFSKLTGDDEFKAILGTAVDGASKIPNEMNDLSLEEGVELATHAMAFVPRFFR